jgi:hypothetical protein
VRNRRPFYGGEDVNKEIVEKISDHLPVVTRFYFSDESED